MASYQDNVPFFSSPKLPAISSGGLVTGNESIISRSVDTNWTRALRKQIDQSINRSGRPHPEDVAQLHKELVKLFIAVLQPNSSKEVWLDLHYALVLVEPYANILNIGLGRIGLALQMQHYIERLYIVYQKKISRLYDIPIFDALGKVYPNEFAVAENKFVSTTSQDILSADFALSGGGYLNKRAKTILITPPETITTAKRPMTVNLPNGRNPFTLIRRGEEPERYYRSKPLTLGKFSQSISVVAGETAMKECLWKNNQSSTVAALTVDLLPPETSDSERWSIADDESTKAVIKSTPTSPRKFSQEIKSITGREAVELFMTDKHLNKVQFMYFNIAENNQYRPYDLVSVHQDKIKPEHYVFSTFGVLHVFPDGGSESMSLADWNRMATLWNVVSKIGFFKNFLVYKCLRHWKITVHRLRLLKMRSFLEMNLIPAVPEFGSALIHVLRLVEELSTLEMLPNGSFKIKQFTILIFSEEVYKMRRDSQNMLEVFFRFCKKVVDVTRQECFDRLKHYENQVRHSNILFNKESLFIQRQKKKVRMKNLEKARQAIGQLSTFINLVDQIIYVHLLQILKTSVKRFVYDVLCRQDNDIDEMTTIGEFDSATPSLYKGHASTHSTKESTTKTSEIQSTGAVFTCKFVFNAKTHQLEMQPSPEKFKETVLSTITNIVGTICEEAHSMGSTEKSIKKNRNDEEESVSSSPRDSSSRSGHSSQALSSSNSSASFEDAQIIGDVDVENEQGFDDLSNLFKNHPSKEEDQMGVATPNLVLSPEPDQRFGLTVDGEGIMVQFNPLNRTKLKTKLMKDEEITAAIQVQNEAIENALEEVHWFCEEHNMWLGEIHEFTSTWKKENLKEWKGKPAQELESMLNKIKAWNDQVKNMDRFIFSNNRLLLVDCKVPQIEVAPVLSTIFKQFISLVSDDAKEISSEITASTKDALKVLENKDLSMSSFAAYARKVMQCKKIKNGMADKVSYIRQLHEVVRMTHRQLTHEEEKMFEKVKSAWETFVFQLKDAGNFVSNQRPIVLKQLDELFKTQYEYILKLKNQASSGSIIDPESNSLEVVTELRKIMSKFFAVRRQLQELSVCRESIEGTKYDLGDLDGMADLMEGRLEVWKYINTSSHVMREWKNTLFRRFNAQTAIDKIIEWQKTAEKLKKNLPENDSVLQRWIQMLSYYACELPLLQKMSEEAVKTRHWKQIFTGMGEGFDPARSFSINDLLSLKLSDNAILIDQVCHSAIAEYKLEQMLRQIKRKWEERQFQLAKHIQVVNTLQQHDEPTGNKKIVREGSLPTFVTQEKDSETFVLVDSNSLMNELSDSHVALQGMLQSHHAAEVHAEAEIWSDTLQQIGEIVRLWTMCQDKWKYLNRVFSSDPNSTQYLSEQISLFENLDRRYREFTKAMVNDPKVLSVLSRRIGQQGWRELQGENLRKHILLCIQMEEELLSNITFLLDKFRSEFPRLYFLCDEDCITLLAVSRQPKKLLPYICKCFSGVKQLLYKMPSSNIRADRLNFGNTLDLELRSNELQVTQFRGHNNEVVEFDSPIETQEDALLWMKIFEKELKKTLTLSLHKIILQRSFGTQQSPTEALEETRLSELEAYTQDKPDIVSKTLSQFRHWLLRYPSQIVLLSESIFWSEQMNGLLKSARTKANYKELIKSIVQKLEQYSYIVKDNAKVSQTTEIRARLQSTLSVAISQNIYYRDVTHALQLNDIASDNCFEWKRIIRHTMKIPDHEFELKAKIQSHNFIQCGVEHMGHKVADYGMEYESAFTDQVANMHSGLPLVITPMTERCLFSLSLALQLGKCGTLIGPGATGKSSLLMQLSRIFGRSLKTVNCSKDIDLPILLQALSGMAESGSWLCFDQVHRLQKNVLSILVEQMKQMQLAYSLLYNSQKSQYSVRGGQSSRLLKRSNSIPGLHSHVESSPESKTWKPQINQTHLTRLSQFKEDFNHEISDQTSQPFGSIVFNGRLLKAKSNYGMFMVMSCDLSSNPYLPENLKLIYRPVVLIKPDTRKMIEIWLMAGGLLSAATLAEKICFALEMIQGITDNINNLSSSSSTEAGSIKIADLSLKEVRSIISMASMHCATSSSSRSDSASSVNSSTKSSLAGSVGRSHGSSNSETLLLHHNEELSLLNCIIRVMSAKLNSLESMTKLKNALRTVFPLATRPTTSSKQDLLLSETIFQQMKISGLQPTAQFTDKIIQLYSTLQLNKAVIIAGPAGCGKTSMYRILAHTINKLFGDRRNDDFRRMDDKNEDQTLDATFLNGQQNTVSNCLPDEKIDFTVLFSNVLDSDHLFGYFDKTSDVWNQGVLMKILNDCNMFQQQDDGAKSPQEKPQAQDNASETSIDRKSLRKWIILDGEINTSWMENMNCLIDIQLSNQRNMDSTSISDAANIIFEVTNFATASPSTISRCGIVHYDGMEQWKLLMDSWLDTAYVDYSITRQTIAIWKEIIQTIVPRTLSFLHNLNENIRNFGLSYEQKVQQSSCYGVSESSSFLRILGSLMNIHLRRDFVSMEDRSYDRVESAADTEATFVSSNRSRLDDNVPVFHHQVAMNLFGFSFVWAYGGQLLQKDMPSFDAFIRILFSELRHKIHYPEYESVFEYFVDEDTGQFTCWEDKIDLRLRVSTVADSSYSFVHQIERYAYLSNILLKSQNPVLIMGKSGCGKSSMVSNILKEDHEMTRVAVSPGLTPGHLQKLIEARSALMLKQHNLGLMAHPNATIDTRSERKQKVLFFVDDLSCAAGVNTENHGNKIQPVHELIRQVISLGGVFDLERRMFKNLEGEINFLATANIAGTVGSGLGHSAHLMSSRLSRLFTVIHFLQPSTEAILSIYHSAVQSWLEEFPAYSLTRHYELSQAIISGAVELYSSVCSHLKVSPRQPHYMFSLHDISHIMQGLFLLSPRTRGRPRPVRRRAAGGRENAGAGNTQMKRPRGGRLESRPRGWGEISTGDTAPMVRTVIRLWMHECSRTFYDRLTNQEDKGWFSSTLQNLMKKHFCAVKNEHGDSPLNEKDRIIKTPIPSAGGTPIPSRPSTSTFSSSFTEDGLQSANDNDGLPDSDNKQDRTSSEGFESRSENISLNETPEIVLQLTDQTESQTSPSNLEKYEDYPALDNTDESLGIYSDALATPDTLCNIQDDGRTSENGGAFSQTRLDSQIEDTETEINESQSGSQSQSDEISGVLEETTSEDTVGQVEPPTTSSSEAITHENDEDIKQESASFYDGDYEQEDDDVASRTMTTAMTGEIESDGSESTSEESENDETTTTSESRSSKSVSREAKTLTLEKINQSMENDNAPAPAGRPRHGGRKMERPTHGRPGGAKHGVTFVPGLIDDLDRMTNTAGPLAQYHQVMSQNENPTSIVFSKNILSVVRGGVDMYMECDEQQLVEALQTAQNKYNGVSSQPQDLVFFEQAIHHIARLSRILSLKQNGHALCFSSTRFTGRKSLLKLVSYICKSKYITPTEELNMSKRDVLRRSILEASKSAGLRKEKVVLLVDENFSSNIECLEDVCALVKNGQCPSFYTHEQLVTVAAEVLPASSSNSSLHAGTATEKLDHSLDEYFNRILSNLHIVVLMPYPSLDCPIDSSFLFKTSDSQYFQHRKHFESLHIFLKRCPELLSRFASVDLYEQWNHTAWMKVGQKYIEEFTRNSAEGCTFEKLISVPWPSDISIEQQANNICHLMAYIHRDASNRLKASSLKYANELVSLTKFRTMVGLFVNISTKVGRTERRLLRRYEIVLRKIQDAEESVAKYSGGKEELLPILDFAQDTERSWKCHVEQERQEYSEAKQRCGIEEEIIEQLDQDLVFLRENAKLALDKVNPLYNVAVEAMQSLTSQGLDELKRYSAPPKSAIVVVKALCNLFDIKPANWENGKALLMRDHFFEELEFFDKDNMPEDIYQALSKNVKDPDFQPERVGKGSRAAELLCIWMHSIHEYCRLSRYLSPKINALRKAEAKLKKAQATLGAKRVRCNQIKEELDSKIQQHKNAGLTVKQYEKDLKNLENKISKSQMLMGNLAEYVAKWREERNLTISRIESAVGDSLLTAACFTYHGMFKKEQREMSIQEWIDACTLGIIEDGVLNNVGQNQTSSPMGHGIETRNFSPTQNLRNCNIIAKRPLAIIRKNFEPNKLIVSDLMQRGWHKAGLPRDPRMRSNIVTLIADSLYQQSSWPLIFDPDNQLRLWIKPIVGSFINLRFNERKLMAADVQDSPYPSSGTASRILNDSSDMYDSESNYDVESQYDESSAYYDDEESMIMSITSTTRTLRSGRTSKKSTEGSTKEVRFADDITPTKPTISKEIPKPTGMHETPSDKTPTDTKSDTKSEKSDSSEKMQKIFICEADNPILSEKINECMKNGFILFVTNIERISHHDQLSLVLLRNRLESTLKQSGSQVSLHSDFRLFLSTEIDMNFPAGDVVPHIAMGICNCINFALGKEGLEEKLMNNVLSQERPEIENHRKLLEADIFHLDEQYEQLQTNLLLKVSNLEEPILSDQTLLGSIQDCKRESYGVETTLSETKIMEMNLLQKMAELLPIAEHGKMIYIALSQVMALKENMYYWTASKFIDIFAKSIASRMRGKSTVNNASMNASSLMKSRVTELCQCILKTVLQQVKQNMFKSDVLVLMTIISLAKLVSQHKMTHDEMMTLMIGMKKSQSDFMKDINKPPWITNDVWEATKMLERAHPSFAGLIKSICAKQKRWQEFISSPPVLLSNIPCDKLHHLGIGQKALLWKTLRPEISDGILSDLCVNVLGSFATEENVWSVHDIIQEIPQNNPIVFVIPENGTSYQPTTQVIHEAESKDIHVIQRTAPFNESLVDIMEECMKKGHWLILHNCELSCTWIDSFKKLLQSLCISHNAEYIAQSDNAGKKEKSIDGDAMTESSSIYLAEDSNLDSERSSDRVESIYLEAIMRHSSFIHENFRVWFLIQQTNEFHSETILPGVLLQHGAIFNLELALNHKDQVKKKFTDLTKVTTQSEIVLNLQTDSRKSLSLEESEKDLNVIKLQLSLLHSLLLQRQSYTMESWFLQTDEDILDLFKFAQYFLTTGQRNALIPVCKAVLCNTVYYRNPKVTELFIEECLAPIENIFAVESIHDSSKILHDLKSILETPNTPNQAINSLLLKSDFPTLNIPVGTDFDVSRSKNKLFLNNLNSVSKLEIDSVALVNKEVLDQQKLLLSREVYAKQMMENYLSQIQQFRMGEYEENEFSDGPVVNFFRNEYKRVKTLIQLVTVDLKTCVAALSGQIEMNPTVLQILEAISSEYLPKFWVDKHPELFHFFIKIPFSKWIGHLLVMVNLLPKYTQMSNTYFKPPEHKYDMLHTCSSTQTPPTYNLAGFLRPDLFLKAFLAEIAKRKYKDAQKLEIKAEVISKSHPLSQSPNFSPDIIILEGSFLQHALYDERSQEIQESSSSKLQRLPPVCLMVEKKTNTHSRQSSIKTDKNMFQCPVYYASTITENPLLKISMKCPSRRSLDDRIIRAFFEFSSIK